jgi:hypothetical protein
MKTTYSGLQEHRIVVYTATGQKAKLEVRISRWGVFGHVLLIVRYPSGLFGALWLALVDCALHVAYVGNATSMPGLCCSYGVSLACTMWCIYGLNYVTACACLYDTSMLASMIYL